MTQVTTSRFRKIFCNPAKVSALVGVFVLLATAIGSSFSQPVLATVGINQQINFQARLLNAQGATVPDGNYNLEFKIYQDGPGTLPLTTEVLKWTETRLNNNTQGVQVKNGYFSVMLGSVNTALNANVDFNQDTLWLSVNVGNTNTTCTPFSTCAADGEMTPFKRLAANPYSLNSGKLGGLTSSQYGQLATTQTFTGTNTFAPTTNISSAVVKQNSSGAFGQDVFSVQGSSSGNFIQVTSTAANAGAVTVQSLGSNNLVLESGAAINVGPANATSINLGRTGLGVAIPATGVVAISLTGVPAATTTSSLIQLTAAIAGGSSSGTYLGANPSSFNGDFENYQVNGAVRFKLNSLGDLSAGFTQLDGSTTTNGTSGITPPSTSLTVTSSVNFNTGNYVQLSDTNCGGAGVNVCYAKITTIAGNVLTISPGLTWTTAKPVVEYHIPELGGVNLTQSLANRYGRGYFISGVATGNGTTYYNEGDITSSLPSFDLLNTAVTTLNIGGAATTVQLGAANSTITLGGASSSISIPGSLAVTGALTAPGPTTGTSGHFQRNSTTLSPAVGGDSISTSGNILTTGSGTITSAGAISAPTATNTINGLIINGGSLTNVGANITGAGAVTLASGAASAFNLTGAAPSTWDIGANTLSLQTAGNGAITTGTGLVTTGGALTSTGILTVNNSALFKNAANSTSAFQVQNLAGAALLKVDTTANNTNNLLTNPSIESAIAGNWQLKGLATVSQDPSQSYSGSNSLNIAATGIGGGAKQNVALSSATTYSLALYARAPSGNVSTFEIGRSEDGTNDVACLTGQWVLKNGWVRLTCAFTTGTTSGTNYIYAKQTDSTTRNLFIDAITLETDANTTTNYREGQISLQASLSTPLTVQNSTNSTTALQILTSKGASILNVDTTDANILAGSAGFEINTLGWTYFGTPGSVLRDATTAYTGTFSLKVITTANANNGAKLTLNSGNPSIAALALSTQYTLSWHDKLDNASAAFTDIVAAYSPDGTAGAEVACTPTSQTVSTGGWGRHICTFTTTATASNTSAYLVIKQAGATAHTFYIDSVQLELGAVATAYGGGNFTLNATLTSPLSFRNTNDSTTAVQIQNASGSQNLLTVDTLNGRVGIGTISPTALFAVGATSQFQVDASSNITSGGNLTFSGTTARSITGPTSGGLTINDTGGNLTVSTTTSGTLAVSSAGALNLTGASPSTWDIGANTLSLQTVGNGAITTGTGLVTTGGALTSTGILTASSSALFKNAANSTSAFQIQNLAGAPLFKVDTTANNTNNLLTNPSIESAIAGNWQLAGAATVTQDASQAYYGSNSLNIAATGAGGGTKQNVALSSNTVYSYALYARVPSGIINTFEIGRSDNGSTDTACLTAQTVLKNGWTRLSCSFTTGTTSGTTYVYAKQTDAATRNVYVDAITLETDANTTTNYHEGQISLQASIASPLVLQNSVNSTTAFQVLTSKGSSVLRVDTTDSNIIAGAAGFEINQVGWAYSGTPGSIARDGTTAYAGSYSLKTVTTANANNGAKITFNAAVPSVTPLAISSTYTVSWYAKLDAASAAFTDIIAAYARDGVSEVNCTGIGTQVVVTGGWTRYSCQIVTDATTPAANAYIVIKQTGATAHTFYIDAMQLELGASATGFGAGAVAFSAPITSPVVFRSTSDSTTAFQIQNAIGTVNLFSVDSLNQKTIIGGATPTITTTGSLTLTTTASGTLAATSAGALNLTGAAPSTWDIGANTLSLQTVGNGAITTGSGLVTHGGNQAVNGGSITTTAATASLFNTTATTLNLGGAATIVSLGAATGTTTVNNNLQVGSATADATQINLQLDSNNTFADTGTCSATTNQGAIYYNTNTNAVRGCVNSSWEDLVTTGGLGVIAFGVVVDSGSQPGDIQSIVGGAGVPSGPCQPYWKSATVIAWTGCAAYSGGRKVIVTANSTGLTLTGGNNTYQHLCLTGTGNQPALSASGTELANLPTWSPSNPVLCLADVKLSAGSAIVNIYDTRVFSNTSKQFVNTAVGMGLNYIAIPSATKVTSTATAAQPLQGVIVASNGVAWVAGAGGANAIMVTSGTAFVKTTAALTAGFIVQTTTTAGYATSIAIPGVITCGAAGTCTANTSIASPYTYLGVNQTTSAAASACSSTVFTCGSALVEVEIR